MRDLSFDEFKSNFITVIILGILPPLPPGLYPLPPPHFGVLPPRFVAPYGPMPPPMGRPRTPPDGPIITGPESVYGTLPRRRAYEEPIYMPGSAPYMPPQASYQPGNYLTDQYDAYYDSLKRQRSPNNNNKVRRLSITIEIC